MTHRHTHTQAQTHEALPLPLCAQKIHTCAQTTACTCSPTTIKPNLSCTHTHTHTPWHTTTHRHRAIGLFICLEQWLMKGQSLSYDRISWPQQPKRGWQSSDCACVCVFVRACVCVCLVNVRMCVWCCRKAVKVEKEENEHTLEKWVYRKSLPPWML